MLWLLVALLTLICCAILLRAVRGPVPKPETEAPESGIGSRAFFRSQLEGIDTDLAGGRLTETEAEAARAELAREYMRAEAEQKAVAARGPAGPVLAGVVGVIAVATVGIYLATGRADLPAQPLSQRVAETPTDDASLDRAVAQVEARMEETPNDVRGWMALGPIYMEMGRYGEAANAFRRVLTLDEPTAETETDLAEALIMVNDGMVTDEAMELLWQATERDSQHVRSRFYLAGELTRTGRNEEAIELWEYLLSIATGEEAWVPTAQSGLAAAQAGAMGETLSDPTPDATGEVLIRGMVEGLAARLYDEGGSLEEWIQLVRSRNVIDGPEAALADFERGAAELEGADRTALTDFAEDLGLEVEN